jgi:hypothetical protein
MMCFAQRARQLVPALMICAFATIIASQRVTAIDPEQPLTTVLMRAGAFVRSTEVSLSTVIADETYQQDSYSPITRSGMPAITQTLRSEVLFLWLPDKNGWLFVRNVQAVNGRTVPDSGDRLDRLLRDSRANVLQYLRQLEEESSRFNIGPPRTTSDPTLGLQFLDPTNQSRFAFSRIGTEKVGGSLATAIAFTEHQRPSAIRVNNADAPASGTIWLNEGDGTVFRTEIGFTTLMLPRVSIRVDFEKDLHLHSWVPIRMTEEYQRASDGEFTVTNASYSNFRRFDISVRVIEP